MTHSSWWYRQGREVRGRRKFPYRSGPVTRVAPSAPSISLPAATAAAPAATTTGRGLAVVVPVTISLLAVAFMAVLITGHVPTVVPFSRVQRLVQIAGLQVVPAVKQIRTDR